MVEKDLFFDNEVSLFGHSSMAELEHKLEMTTSMLKKISSVLGDQGHAEASLEIDNFLRRMDL